MKIFKCSAKNALSTLLAILMLLSVFSVVAPVAFAVACPISAEDIEDIVLDPITLIQDYDSETETEEVDGSDVDWQKYSYESKIEGKITFKNGETTSVDRNTFWDDDENEYNFTLTDDQSVEHPWEPGEHKVTAAFEGMSVEVYVEVQENPVKSIACKDIEIYDYFNVDDSGEFPVFTYKADYTVELKDGTTLEPDEDGDVKIAGHWMYPTIKDDQSEETPWTTGNTYTAHATFMGKTADFEVKVNENPVKSVDVKNVEIYDGIDSATATSWDGDDNPIYWKRYYYPVPEYTVELRDGTKLNSDEDGDVKIMDRWRGLDYEDNQSATSEWSIGANTVEASFCGVKDTFDVVVKPSPVKSVEFSDTISYMGFDQTTKYYGEDDDNEYTVYTYTPEYTVTLTDDTVLKSVDGYVTIYGEEIKPDYEDDQAPGNTWTLGNHTVTGTVGGVSDDFTVELADNPVVKIEPRNKTAQKGIDVAYRYDDDYNRFTVVDPSTRCVVTFVDGTTCTSDYENCIKFHGSYRELDFTDDQTADNIWDVGVHKATVSYGDVSADYKVNVTAAPFTKLEVEDVVVYKGLDTYNYYGEGDDDEGTLCYRYDPAFKLTDAEGNVVESDYDYEYGAQAVVYDGRGYTLDFEDDQLPFSWSEGKHTVSASIFGIKAEFTVEVKANPVESIEAKDVELYENVDGDWDEYDDIPYFYYFINKGEFIVHFKDGSTVESEDGVVSYNNNKYYAEFDRLEQSGVNPLNVGDTQTVTGTLMGVEFSAKVTIVASPVKKIKVEPVELYANADCDREYDDDADEYYDHYYLRGRDLKCKVTLGDGTVLESEDGTIYYNGASYDIYTSTNQSYANAWGIGTHKAKAFVMGQEVEFDVVISEYPIKSVEIDDVEFEEETNGYVDESYYYYDVTPEKFTVTLEDGTKLNATEGYLIINGRYFTVNDIKTDQSYSTPWTPGNTYTVTATFFGIETSYKVTITPKKEVDFPTEASPDETSETTAPTEATEPTTAEPQETTAPATEPTTAEPQETTIAPTEATTAPATEATTAPATQAPEAKTTLTLNKTKATVYVKKSTVISYSVTNPVGAVKFKSLNKKIAKVNKKGKVTGVKKGKTVIVVSNNGVSKRFTITVKNPKLKKAKKTLKKGKTFKIKIKGLVGKAKFKSSNKKIAKVSKKGKITAKSKGKATITVTANGVKLKFKLKVK